MSAKGMGDKRPAAIASAGDAASGAAAMHTPYGRLRNRARTRSVRPPRPVRCAIRAGWRAGQQLHGLRASRRRSRDEVLAPGLVCLPWGKMRGARFCAVAFLSGVPIPHPVCTLHAFPHGRQIRRRRSLRAIFIPRWPSSGTKSAIRRRRGRRSAQRNHIPIIHKLFVKCKFNE